MTICPPHQNRDKKTMPIKEINLGYIPQIPKTLYTGEVVNCDDERWREEIEARGLLRLPLHQRREQLDRIEKISKVRADKLKELMAILYKLK